MERNKLYLNRQDSGNSTSDFFAQSDKNKPVRKLITPSSSLEIIDGDKYVGASGYSIETSPSDASFRSWSRYSVGSIPPRSDSSMTRRSITPTKQVSLQAVRRIEESSKPFVDHIDVESARLEGGIRRAWDFKDDDVDFSKLSVGDHRQTHKKSHVDGGSSNQSNGLPDGNKQSLQLLDMEVDSNKQNVQKLNKKNRKDSSSDDDDDDEDKDENDKFKAPTELLMEFIDCLMKKDFPNASKLCKMILLYEPENEEALKFQPLIEEKMALDAEAAAAEEVDSDDDDEDDDDDDSDEDSSSDGDSTEDDDDDDNESGEKVIATQPAAPPSGKEDRTPRVVGANSTRVWKPAS